MMAWYSRERSSFSSSARRSREISRWLSADFDSAMNFLLGNKILWAPILQLFAAGTRRRQQGFCSAAVPAAVRRASRPPRRGRDALGTAGRMPALRIVKPRLAFHHMQAVGNIVPPRVTLVARPGPSLWHNWGAAVVISTDPHWRQHERPGTNHRSEKIP